MEPCTPEKVAAQSRYRRHFPTLSADVRADAYARMRELVEEERGALQLRASLDEAVEHAVLLDVYDVGGQTDGPVVGEGVDLVGPGDAARLVAHVAGVVPEPRDGDLRDEDLFRVAARADHAPAAVQAAAGATTLWYTSSRMSV